VRVNALLIVNPEAGRMRRIGAPRLASLLAECGVQTKLISAPDQAHARAELRAELFDRLDHWQRIIVAGGDGSIRAVLSELADFRIATQAEITLPSVAIFPVGSVNVLARALGLPFALSQAAQVAAQGATRKIDLGRFSWQSSQGSEARYFVLMAGFGFDGDVVNSARRDVKIWIGAFEYILQGLRLFFQVPLKHHLTINTGDSKIEACCWQMIVANTPNYSYQRNFTPHARMDDGLLEVCILPERGRLARTRQLLAILAGLPQAAGIQYLASAKISLHSDNPVAVQLDGDPMGLITQAQVDVLPQMIEVMVKE
jgi:diacylglycerol kinase (ATP)